MSPSCRIIRSLWAALALLLLSACATQEYRPAPLDAEAVAETYAARTPDDPGLRDFFARHGRDTQSWPPARWDLEALTLMAVYFHPDMDVARADLGLKEAGRITAGQRPNPKAGPLIEHHSGEGDVDSPWSLGLSLGLPIETGDKRAARIARAEALTEEARLALAQTAWQVRSRLRRHYIEVYGAEALAALLRREREIREHAVALLERRQSLGEASPSEASLARLHLQEVHLALDAAEGNIRTARASLAGALGLSFEAAGQLSLDFAPLSDADLAAVPPEVARAAALKNRLDIHQGLARYAAAEATLREEIAKQFPDLELSPGLLWDQGDWVKSIGAFILLPILNRNEGPIAEAEARRSLEAARFKSLEAGVLTELSRARVRYEARLSAWGTAKGLVSAQAARVEQVKKLIAHGEADRLSLVVAEIEAIAAERAELQARLDALEALGGLEDAVQRPLGGGALLPEMAGPAAGESGGEAPGP